MPASDTGHRNRAIPTLHTFKPSYHGTAHCTCRYLRRYVEWSGKEWASKTGPSFGLSGRETLRRYEHVE